MAIQTRQGLTTSKFEVQLFSIHLPSEVWGGDFNATLREQPPDATAGAAGRRRRSNTRICPATMSAGIIKEHVRGRRCDS